MFRLNRRKARHLAARTNVTAYMEARARGGHATTEDGVSILPRRSAHAADLPAVLGLDDINVDALCAEVRAELDTPINTKAVTA